jgi:hypothetical protein
MPHLVHVLNMARTNIVKVLLSDEEFRKIRDWSGTESVSGYARRKLLVADLDEVQTPKDGDVSMGSAKGRKWPKSRPSRVVVGESSSPGSGGAHTASVETTTPSSPKPSKKVAESGKCPHGYVIGSICFDCGGTAHA